MLKSPKNPSSKGTGGKPRWGRVMARKGNAQSREGGLGVKVLQGTSWSGGGPYVNGGGTYAMSKLTPPLPRVQATEQFLAQLVGAVSCVNSDSHVSPRLLKPLITHPTAQPSRYTLKWEFVRPSLLGLPQSLTPTYTERLP